jgi:hypothetical protein
LERNANRIGSADAQPHLTNRVILLSTTNHGKISYCHPLAQTDSDGQENNILRRTTAATNRSLFTSTRNNRIEEIDGHWKELRLYTSYQAATIALGSQDYF